LIITSAFYVLTGLIAFYSFGFTGVY